MNVITLKDLKEIVRRQYIEKDYESMLTKLRLEYIFEE